MAQIFESEVFVLPGIGTGAAYADLDAIGKPIRVHVPKQGIIYGARYHDLDDEGLQIDLVITRSMIAMPTDNSALAFDDFENLQTIAVVSFTSFQDLANNQFSQRGALGYGYRASRGEVFVQGQARGAVNIAAANQPRFQLIILDLDE